MKSKAREIPDIELTDIEDYARPLAKGWDTVKETFKVGIPDSLLEQLAITKRDGIDNRKDGVMIQFGGEDMRLFSKGAGGCLFAMENDDFRIFIKPPEFKWCVSVEYTAAGLWEYGLEVLRERAIKAVLSECKPLCTLTEIETPVNWQRVSLAHFAFDFHSPEFTKDMTPDLFGRVICPAPVKKDIIAPVVMEAYGRGPYLETLTIGNKSTLQVQIYDKGKEITAVSGKTWMFKIWAKAGYVVPVEKDKQRARDVWRLEIRFGSKFLKDRGILTMEELHDMLHALLTEALFTRRLTVQAVSDKNRWRWPMHPLFVCAYKQTDGLVEMPPLGRQKTESDEAKAASIKRAIAGNLRSLTVLAIGDMDEASAMRLVMEAYDLMLADPDGEKKNEKARLRYFYEKEAR